jgi:hypothetical protein
MTDSPWASRWRASGGRTTVKMIVRPASDAAGAVQQQRREHHERAGRRDDRVARVGACPRHLGLGRIVALHRHLFALHQIHKHDRYHIS